MLFFLLVKVDTFILKSKSLKFIENLGQLTAFYFISNTGKFKVESKKRRMIGRQQPSMKSGEIIISCVRLNVKLLVNWLTVWKKWPCTCLYELYIFFYQYGTRLWEGLWLRARELYVYLDRLHCLCKIFVWSFIKNLKEAFKIHENHYNLK